MIFPPATRAPAEYMTSSAPVHVSSPPGRKTSQWSSSMPDPTTFRVDGTPAYAQRSAETMGGQASGFGSRPTSGGEGGGGGERGGGESGGWFQA